MNRDNKNKYHLTLYITNNAPNSQIAKQNLSTLEAACTGSEFEIEIIDVIKKPELALKDGIYITPALRIEGDETDNLIFGNLSNLDKIKNMFS